MAVYLLQIVEGQPPHKVVVARGAALGRLEINLVTQITKEILARAADKIAERGIGLLKTEAQVKQAINDGLQDTVEVAVQAVITRLKLRAPRPGVG